MIPLLIFWLFKKIRRKQTPHYKQGKAILTINKISLLFLFTIIFYAQVFAQQRTVKYNIMHDGERKGSMILTEEIKGNTKHVKIESEVKVRFILSFKIHSIEEAIFENGILIYSSLSRKINDDEKVGQRMELKGSVYKIICKNDCDEVPTYPVYNSILSLYCSEPVTLNSVYSDNFRKYVTIENKGNNVYKVSLPNGNNNYYSYKEGICVKVDVQQSFYPIQFIITK